MSVVIDNSHGSFLSEVDSLRDLIGVESEAELQEWRYLFVIHKFGLEEIVTKLNILNEEYDFLHASNPIEHIQTRIKNPKKTVEKLIRQGYPVSAQSAREHLYDLGGIRVVCSFVEDVYELYDKLARQADLEIIEVIDYALSKHKFIENPSLTDILQIEQETYRVIEDKWS